MIIWYYYINVILCIEMPCKRGRRKGALSQCIIEPAHEKRSLSHRQPAKAKVRLRISAVSPEPLLFADL